MNIEEIIHSSSKLIALLPKEVTEFPATIAVDRTYVVSYPDILISRTNKPDWVSFNGLYYKVIKNTGKKIQTKLGKLLKESMPDAKDNIVRDIVSSIVASIFPVDKIIMCKSSEDYTTMFITGEKGSCMTVDNNYFGKNVHDVWRKLGKQGHYPSSLYHYSPEVAGVYVTDEEENPIARTHVRLNEKGEIISFGIIRGTPKGYSLLIQALQEFKSFGKYELTKPFVVPGIKYKDKYLLPIPNIDDISTDKLWYKWDHDSTSFLIKPSSSPGYHPVGYTYSRKGYIVHDGTSFGDLCNG